MSDVPQEMARNGDVGRLEKELEMAVFPVVVDFLHEPRPIRMERITRDARRTGEGVEKLQYSC
jgi:hypothetical protein